MSMPEPVIMGAETVRTRSASNRSLPAETGVWMVNTERRRTSSRAASKGTPAATSSRARSTSRNAE